MGSQPWIIPAIRKVGKGHLDSVLMLVNADRANPSATAAVGAVSCETLLSWANASERSVGVSALSALQSAQGMGFECLGASAFYLPRESSGFCNLVRHNTEAQHLPPFPNTGLRGNPIPEHTISDPCGTCWLLY